MNVSNGLFPCPWCGGKSELHFSQIYSVVWCSGCSAQVMDQSDQCGQGPCRETPKLAIDQWNTIAASMEALRQSGITPPALVADPLCLSKLVEAARLTTHNDHIGCAYSTPQRCEVCETEAALQACGISHE